MFSLFLKFSFPFTGRFCSLLFDCELRLKYPFVKAYSVEEEVGNKLIYFPRW